MSKFVLLVVAVVVLCTQASPVPQYNWHNFGPPLFDPLQFVPNYFNHMSTSGGMVGVGTGTGFGMSSISGNMFTHDFGGDSGNVNSQSILTENDGGNTVVHVFGIKDGEKYEETFTLKPKTG